MNAELFNALDLLEKESGISKEYMLTKIEEALANALKNGVIRASCHDVVKVEPMAQDCPLFGIENCYITPHVAWAGSETRQRLVNICAKNIECFISGNPQNVVNK